MTITSDNFTDAAEIGLSSSSGRRLPLFAGGGVSGHLVVGAQPFASAKEIAECWLYFANDNSQLIQIKLLADSTRPVGRSTSNAVLRWLCQNPGMNASHVAEVFGIPPIEAIEIVEGLLADGSLELA